jgi:hypothetical protein
VKYLPLLAVVLLAGCETLQNNKEVEYTKLTVTDPSGQLVAEWIAEGRVRKAGSAAGSLKRPDEGYDIMAVERRTSPPHPLTLRYPNRRAATVVGPNIVLEKIEKPEWLKQLDSEGG